MRVFRPSPSERLLALGIRWAILAFGVWAAANLVDGMRLEGAVSILAVALIIGLLNVFIKPLLVLVSLPLTVLTFGLFLIVINAGLLFLASWIAERFMPIRFSIDGPLDAVLGAVVISVAAFIVTRFVNPERIARDLNRRL